MKIFTLATHRREDAASWILCCKRTYILFERLLYNKIVLNDEDHACRFLQCYRLRQMHIDTLPSTRSMFFGDGIKYATLVEILSLCKDITNLSIVSHDDDVLADLTSLHHVLEPLPLTVLCLNTRSAPIRSSMMMVNIFATLTHLEIDDKEMLRLVDMHSFPKLTHLALWPVFGNTGMNVGRVVKHLLEHPTLQVLVFRATGHRAYAKYLEYHQIYDPRIIIGPSQILVWDDFGRGDMLLWQLADERANMPGPNHRKHRCFSNSTFNNRFRDYLGLPRVRERDVDRELVKCFVVGGSHGGEVRVTMMRNESSDEDSTDDDMNEDSSDEDVEDGPPNGNIDA